MIAETWAEQDLNEYLERYSRGCDETEKRTCTCDFCGGNFDYLDGKIIEPCVKSRLRIQGKRPEVLYICNYCYESAYDIEMGE